MSEVIGKWIIQIQDAMPDEIRNSQRWKSLLPLAAGTGREREQERLAIIMDWMWSTVLPALQPVAEEGGYGEKWLAMTTRRNDAAARVAAVAADAVAYAADAEEKPWWAARAAVAAWAAAEKAAYAADAAAAVAGSAADAAAVAAEKAAAAAAAAAVDTEAWTTFDPYDLLERLIRVGEQSPAT